MLDTFTYACLLPHSISLFVCVPLDPSVQLYLPIVAST